MKILTGNDLKTGAVTWWTGYDWSLHVEDAVDAGDESSPAEFIVTAQKRSQSINSVGMSIAAFSGDQLEIRGSRMSWTWPRSFPG